MGDYRLLGTWHWLKTEVGSHWESCASRISPERAWLKIKGGAVEIYRYHSNTKWPGFGRQKIEQFVLGRTNPERAWLPRLLVVQEIFQGRL